MHEINQIVVSADLVARSHPSGHSVPLLRKRERSKNRYPHLYLMIGVLVSLIATAATGTAFYYSDKMHRDAGYHLVCNQIVLSKTSRIDCIWEKAQPPRVE